MKSIISILIFTFSFNHFAIANIELTTIGSYGSWKVQEGGNMCFSLNDSSPDITFLVSNFYDENTLNESSIVFSRQLKKDSKVKVITEIGNTFTFFTIENRAWLDEGQDEDKFFRDMINSNTIAIDYITDDRLATYSTLDVAGIRNAINDCNPGYVATLGNINNKSLLEEQKIQKEQRIKLMKEDCEDLGFSKNTEAMGNCVLKLMELEGKSYEASSSNQDLINIERQKLQTERERLEVDKNRAWIERQMQLRQIGKESAVGFCLMQPAWC